MQSHCPCVDPYVTTNACVYVFITAPFEESFREVKVRDEFEAEGRSIDFT